MAYEIPQQLEYKEKIIFGLTFSQLAYLFLFVPLIIYVYFKSAMPIFFKIFFSINLGGLAIGFIFLDLSKHLKNIYIWFRSRRIQTPIQMSKFIPIKGIKDDLIITNDKKKIAVIKVEPINFAIKPDNAKEAITFSFQRFLNSLDFPVQILMITEGLDLKEYFSGNKK